MKHLLSSSFVLALFVSIILLPTTSHAAISTILKFGSRGAQVTELQTYLIATGYLNSEPTGFFGPLTQSAVQALQKAHNLEQVGYTGPLTRALVNQGVPAAPVAASSVPKTTTTPVATPQSTNSSESSKSSTVAAPRLTFKTSTSSISAGSRARLSWSTKNATSCTAGTGWAGAKSTRGTERVTPTTSTSYTLTCVGSGGSVTKSVKVSVVAAAPVPAPSPTPTPTPVPTPTPAPVPAPTPTPSGTVVRTTPELMAALTIANAGDTILLAPGNYATIGLQGVNKSGMVTIKSQDPSNMAVVKGMELSDTSNLTFKEIEFTLNTRTQDIFHMHGCHDITADKLKMHDVKGSDRANALIRDCSNVRITNSKIYDVGGGVNIVNSNNVLVSGNDFRDMKGDGIQGSSASYDITIKNNTFTDFYPAPGDHPDVIQFFTLNSTSPIHDITVSGNKYVRGSGGIVQGIFFGNEASLTYEDITFTNNIMIGTMYNGIALGGADRVTITGNVIQPYVDMGSAMVLQSTKNVTLADNKYGSYIDRGGNTNLTSTNNTILAPVPVGDTSILSSLGNVAGVSRTLLTSRLSKGSSGEEVKSLQEILVRAGYYDGEVTGYFGPLTEAAVIKYQVAHAIDALGIVGPQTRNALNAD